MALQYCAEPMAVCLSTRYLFYEKPGAGETGAEGCPTQGHRVERPRNIVVCWDESQGSFSHLPPFNLSLSFLKEPIKASNSRDRDVTCKVVLILGTLLLDFLPKS